MTQLLIRFLASSLTALGLMSLPAAWAQSDVSKYPDRPIKLIVPYPPGGSADPAARLIAGDIGPRLGQTVVVENKAGAAGAIGTEAVARAAPDGYTLLLHTSVISTDPHLKPNAPYDVQRDLMPVSLVVKGPYLLVVNPSLPARNVGELIAYAKANPGKLSFGSAGLGSSGHLIGELFKQAAGIDMIHVPYKGGGPSIVGLAGNEVQLVFDTFSGSKALAESGKLRAIAVTGDARSPLMPQVPTVSESGLNGFTAEYWLGIFAPARTPPAIIARLHEVISLALQNPVVRDQTMSQGNVPQALGPVEFAKVFAADIARYKAVIESARIRPQ